eukprot:gnl/TRDRNA2_/TRDRNA2_164525_c1_seq1.p1 gnl/TRDRNA2_/TRDRNA2_164525_c1~~gnl/TRDRNA2_/TRDRNA2_164525_c1_seq1.p1  ORF type:complete len:495 (+),score=39.75 gnl/TRDRNA2_/TRDRNA2_164525_c1_seq1:172-1656(+)
MCWMPWVIKFSKSEHCLLPFAFLSLLQRAVSYAYLHPHTLSIALLSTLAPRSAGLYDPGNHTVSARIYGNINKYAYYYVDLQVGTPPQRVSTILDTGSSFLGFPCSSCDHCGHHIDPGFAFGSSSSASWVSCGPGCNNSCEKGHCAYEQVYTEGSSISGFMFEDEVRLGDTLEPSLPVRSRMGCHQHENKLFYTQRANGILGIFPKEKKGTTMLQDLFKDTRHIKSDIFAICLAEWGGRFVVGGYNVSYHTKAIEWIPMNMKGGNYAVDLTTMQVRGRKIFQPKESRAYIDSGTTYVYMDTKMYRSLRNAIDDHCTSHGDCGARRLSDQCWYLPELTEGLRHFPKIDVFFGHVRTLWEPKGYMNRKGDTSEWCYAFMDDGDGADTVLGANWMLHKDVIFDLDSMQVGIAQAACPEYRRRPWGDYLPHFEPLSFSDVVWLAGVGVAASACWVVWRQKPVAYHRSIDLDLGTWHSQLTSPGEGYHLRLESEENYVY